MYSLVVIGASWGGLEAITRVLTRLPEDLGCALAVVQHRSEHESALATLLGTKSRWPVHEADDKEPIRPGHLYVAPPNYHLLVESGCFALSTDAPVQYSRPSVDVLFESAADEFHNQVIGVVLTGANHDGARGLARIRSRGGYTIVQDPTTARRPEMPRAAIAACSPDAVLPLEEISGHLLHLCRAGDHSEILP